MQVSFDGGFWYAWGAVPYNPKKGNGLNIYIPKFAFGVVQRKKKILYTVIERYMGFFCGISYVPFFPAQVIFIAVIGRNEHNESPTNQNYILSYNLKYISRISGGTEAI